MSRSKNVRSRYQDVPEYLRVSVSVRDVEGSPRARDKRAKEKQEIRATLVSILENTTDESNDDWKW